MKTISLGFLAVLALAATGCKKHGADCESAIARGMELSKADMQKHPGVDEKAMQKLRDIGIQHCKDDKWPEDAIKCMVDAKTETESQGCYAKLSADQQAKMNAAAWGAASPAGAGSAAAGDWGSAGGAAAGSAMAGSAMMGSAMTGSDMGAGSAGSAAK
jgi:hypothetical protein